MKRGVIILVIAFTLGFLGYSGYSLWGTYVLQQEAEIQEENLRLKQLERRNEIIDMARDALPQLSEHKLQQGFWYTTRNVSGQEDIFYFNVDNLVQKNVSNEDVLRIAEVINESRISSKDTMRVLPENELPVELQFHNSVYSFGRTGNILDRIDTLKKTISNGSYTANDLFQLGYLFELTGRYAERDAIHERSCREFSKRCADNIDIKIIGRVVDKSGSPIQGVAVKILGRPGEDIVTTGADGRFIVSTKVNKLEKLRLRATKRNFSDGVTDVVVVSELRDVYNIEDVVLESPITIVTVDTKKKTITGVNNKFLPDDSIELRTQQSTYIIPKGAVVHENGNAYEGVYDVYLYEFTKETVPESLIEVDTFDNVMGYAGDLMKTFGMPYIQFFTPEGEELQVFSENPMKLTYKIVHMKELYENTDQIYRPLTNEDMEVLVDASIGIGYPIDREFLIKHGLLNFPAFWVFDRHAGVWDNIGIRVKNVNGEIETLFYTARSK